MKKLNTMNDGYNGIQTEVATRKAVAEYVGTAIVAGSRKSARHADLKVKTASNAILTIEVKTGCGWLVNPTLEQAQAVELLEDLQALKKAIAHSKYFAYAPTAQDEVLIMPKGKFVDILAQYGILRAKKGSNGAYGVAIQSYIPTPTFRASKERYRAILDTLFDNGEYIDCFLDRVNAIEILDEVRA